MKIVDERQRPVNGVPFQDLTCGTCFELYPNNIEGPFIKVDPIRAVRLSTGHVHTVETGPMVRRLHAEVRILDDKAKT